MKVYLVHRGFGEDEQTKERKAANPLTFRCDEEHAESIVNRLNQMYVNLRYFEFTVARSEESLGGDADAMAALAARDKSSTNEEFVAYLKGCQDVFYSVTEIELSGDSEQKFEKEMRAQYDAKMAELKGDKTTTQTTTTNTEEEEEEEATPQ